MYCINCGKILQKDAKFCGFCGNEIVDDKIACKRCGFYMENKVNFCTNCGWNKNYDNAQIITLENKDANNKTSNDFLFKLGLIFIIIGGLFIATTNWNNFSEIFKSFLLLLVSLGTFLSYKFSKQQNKFAQGFLIISILFMTFFYISLGTNQVFGSWFALGKDGGGLFTSSALLMLGVLYRFAFRLETKKYYDYLSYISIIFSLLIFIDFLRFNALECLLIFGVLNLICLLLNVKDNALNKISVILTFVMPILGIQLINSYAFNFVNLNGFIIGLSTGLMLYINSYFVSTKNKENKALNNILIVLPNLYLLAFCVNILNYNNFSVLKVVVPYAFSYIIIWVLSKIFGNANITYFKTHKIVSTAIILATLVLNLEKSLGYIIGVIVAFIINFINEIKADEKENVTFYKVAKIILFVLFVIEILLLIGLNNYLVMLISLIISGLITFIKKEKAYYYPACIVSNILVFSLSIDLLFGLSNDFLPALIRSGVLVAIYTTLLGFNNYKISQKKDLIISKISFYYLVIMLIVIIHISLMALDLFKFDSLFINSIISIILTFIYYVVFKNSESLKFILGVSLIVPLTVLVNSFNFPGDITTILLACSFLGLIYLLSYKTSDATLKKVVTIGCLFVSLMLTLYDALLVMIFGAIVFILFIYVGFSNVKFKSLYYIGISSIIVKVIIEYFKIIEYIPLSLYLLIIGIVLLIFALRKQNK